MLHRELTSEEAISRGRSALRIAESVLAQAWRIARLDRAGEVYYLVVFGEKNASMAVAAVHAERGDVETSARLPGLRPHLSIEATSAKHLAGAGDSSIASLVWRPCSASRSPLYPLWEIRDESGCVYVDQQSRVWHALSPNGPG